MAVTPDGTTTLPVQPMLPVTTLFTIVNVPPPLHPGGCVLTVNVNVRVASGAVALWAVIV